MALPVAHCAVALGATDTRSWKVRGFLCLLVLLPDFDFALVWIFGIPVEAAHRTFSHSISFALAAALIWPLVRPPGLREISGRLFFFVLMSHGLLDLLCTQDAADHGVALFWPFSDQRFGFPVLVPLYQLVADSPFSFGGALRFTLVEIALAPLLWFGVRGVRSAFPVGNRREEPRSFRGEPKVY